MKSLAFFLLSAFAMLSTGTAFKGCESERMNELCQSEIVDHCYTCVKNHDGEIRDIVYPHPPVCVPVFHNNLGVLDNYPVKQWNCTLYRPTSEVFDEDMANIASEISNDAFEFQEELNDEETFVKDICKVDDFITALCEHEDKNGFCMIANYVHDICESNEDDKSVSVETKDYQVTDYVSPWGSKSECITKDYKRICSDSVTKSCFDCRTPTLLSYYHLCFPLFASENENALVTRLKNDKWECKKFSNPRYKPTSFQVASVDTTHEEELFGGKLYSACTGSICRKEGWTYRADHFGKEWCGNTPCKEYFGNRVLCSFPTNCNTKKSVESLSVVHETFQNEFKTLGCGSEKIKCMLKKSCRNLVKQLENCDGDQMCLYTVISQSTNDTFNDLVKCMYP